MFGGPAARLRRALTFQRVYRCRNCNALFEALLSVRQEFGKRGPDCNNEADGS
jgi:hypothetical protein